jgi:HlyD family secretion protein
MRSRALIMVPWLFLVACGGNDRATIHTSGHVEATDVRISSKVGGRLLEVAVDEGDSVAAEEIVAQIDTIDAVNELARARAELARADAQVRLLEAGPRHEDLVRATEEVARADAELQAAQRDLERIEDLAARRATTPKALDDARTRRDIAARSVRALNAARERLVAGARQEEVQIALAQRDAARALVAAAEQRLDDTTVRSPLAGVVTTRAAEPGEVVPPGALLCAVSDLAHPWLVVYLDEPSLGQVSLGDTVSVRVDGARNSLQGVLTHVASVAEFTPKNVQTPDERAKLVYKAKVALENPTGMFKPGMPADAIFTVTRQSGQ